MLDAIANCNPVPLPTQVLHQASFGLWKGGLLGTSSIACRNTTIPKVAAVEFIHQPNTSDRLGDQLLANLSKQWTHFRAAVAFAKRSGTRHIVDALKKFAQVGDVEMVVGIDHCGTSVEGLADLLEAAEPNGRILVFHNRRPFTFHPKVYLFKSPSEAEVYIGSGNLTEGGLFTNYEAMIRLGLDLGDPGQRAFLQSIENVLDEWADLSSGTARVLDDDLLKRLKSAGLVVPEGTFPNPGAGATQSGSDAGGGAAASETENGDGGSLFPAVPVPRAPIVARSSASGTSIQDAATPSNEPSDPSGPAGGQMHFVMTLQRTDVGVGQVNPGTAKRSPEIFIPLAARDAHPQFWGWPGQFVTVVTAKKKQHPVRSDVRMRFGAQAINVTMMVSTVKHDLRLRNGKLRSAGDVDDILHLYEASSNLGYSYIVEVIPQQDRNYQAYLARCANSVRNSKKRWGYY